MSDILGHFKTITRHRHAVIVNCAKAGILWQGLRHDLSKYSPTEFWPGARFYTGKRSPNDGERVAYGFSRAWLHHKGRNRHHFEYWTDYNIAARKTMPVKMPLRYAAELFCDRVAASKIYRGSDYDRRYPLEYFERGDAPRSMHPETRDLVRALLTMLAEKGEAETFAYLKALVRAGKEY